jgi:signal transduction histidine kinase
MRRFLLLAGFVLSAAVLLGALAWVSHLSIDIESREREARQRAGFEERVRLSLWRMDSAVAGWLAQENAGPAEPVASAASAAAPLPHLAARFEIGPAGETREWWTAFHGPKPGTPALQRDVLLAGLRQGPLASRPEPNPGSEEPPHPARVRAASARPASAQPPAANAAVPATPSPAAPAPPASAAVAPSAAAAAASGDQARAPHPKQATSAEVDALPAKAQAERRPDRTGDPVAREMANQSQLNRIEFEKRAVQNQAFGPQAATPPSGALGPTPAEASPAAPAAPAAPPSPAGKPADAKSPDARSPDAKSPATSPSPRPAPPPAPPRHSSSVRRRPAGPAAVPPGRALGAVSAVWVGDDLVLARRVARGGDEVLQGARLDGSGIREWLAAQVRDLLPRAALFPLLPGDTADPGRRLALLPLRLDAGPLPAAPPAGASPLRLGLAVASLAVLLSIGAAGLQLAATLRLARRRADFVSAVTHELRTPLTTFRLYTEMLADGMVPAAERPAYLDTLRDEADRLGHLVENVLAFARLDRGRAEVKVESVELAPLVAEAAARLARRVERDGLTLATEVPPEAAAARVRVDRFAVERILQNLADNACKYGRNAADPRLHLTVQLREGRALLTLRDHGRGLDRDERRRLFRPFHRSAEQATGDAPGVGLGLALSRRLARGFGGDLRALDPAAAAGEGAAFELSLPLAT